MSDPLFFFLRVPCAANQNQLIIAVFGPSVHTLH